jgi:DNA ligase 1
MEKYDGVRAFWNPIKRTFFSRTGKPFAIPSHIVNAMPSDIFLDGEIWYCETIL